MLRGSLFAALFVFLLAPVQAPGKDLSSEGIFKVGNANPEPGIPKQYHLDPQTLNYKLFPKYKLEVSQVEVYHLQFQSPFKSKHEVNNLVHGEYYLPPGAKNAPATVVLDITGGNQALSRMVATHLASRGVAALFIQMAYYGPRRPPNSKLRLLSPDLNHTFLAIRQTVLDVRAAVAWLEQRKEVDPTRLGITGTSLGSMIGALSAEMEPKVSKVVVLLGGAGLVDGYFDHPYAKALSGAFVLFGGSRNQVKQMLSPVDPLTRAENLKGKQLLQFAGRKDDIVPASMAEALWEAAGKQEIHWYNCGHYTAAWYFLEVVNHIADHMKKAPPEK
ncbi:MAG: abhydrolase domain-containing 18 [Gemmataceae bacterium]|nr:abhydrolase domain-containing 18 [Gemmataceae bacterium]